MFPSSFLLVPVVHVPLETEFQAVDWTLLKRSGEVRLLTP